VGARAREERPGQVFIGAGGRLGASEVTTMTRARGERSWDGRGRAPLRRPMARHGRCTGRWIDATWRGPLATDGTGELPPAQRSDQRSLRRHSVRARHRLLTVKIRQPSHEFTFGVGMSFIPYPLVLTPVV
jgi:hypothetical protein